MASAIDPTLGGDLSTPSTNVRKSQLETALTSAKTEITTLQTDVVEAEQWATKTTGVVADGEFSSKAYAIGGTGVSTSAGKGAAKEWATATGAAVDTAEFSAKEYATGTTATLGSSKSWATVTGGVVVTGEYSSKEWAQGTIADSAKRWATSTTVVSGGLQGAKGYADDASTDATASAASATASAASAVTAGTAKTGAETARDTALTYKNAAATSATAASSSETAAASSATSASGSSSSSSTSASNSATSATKAENYAVKVDAYAESTDNSSKSWAIGGTSTGQPSAGDAKSWATTTGSLVSGDYSAKEWASGTTSQSAFQWAQKTGSTVDGGTGYSSKEWAAGTTAQSSYQWAQKTGSTVDGASGYSSKEWSIGTTVADGSSKDWSTSTTVVSGGLKGSKGYAEDAAASAASINTPTLTSADPGKHLQVNVGYDGYILVVPTDTDEHVSISATDTTPGFLNGKLVAGTNISLTVGSGGGNETLTVAATSTGDPAGTAVAMSIALG
jgi:hypothetical protein